MYARIKPSGWYAERRGIDCAGDEVVELYDLGASTDTDTPPEARVRTFADIESIARSMGCGNPATGDYWLGRGYRVART